MEQKRFWGMMIVFALFEVVSLFAQATIRLKPTEAETWMGRPVQLDIWIDHAQNLGAFQFELIYGSHIVHADTAWIGPFLGSTGRTVIPVGPDMDNTGYPGKLTFGSASFGTVPGPDSSGILAHVVFIPKGEGSTTVEFYHVVFSDVNGNPLSVNQRINALILVHPYDSTLVTNTNDSGPGSLREALSYANSHPGPDTIRFNIPTTDPGCDSAGVFTLRPTLPFYLVDSCTVIDGFSQPGAAPNTNLFGEPINAKLKIVLDGTMMANPYESAIYVLGQANVVRGLVVSGFRRGIDICGETAYLNRIEGNFIGTDASGKLDRGNHLTGIVIGPGHNNFIGGTSPEARNLISGNDSNGIEIGPPGKNRIQGNYIGTDATGASPLGNRIGIRIFNVSQKNLIGGAEEGSANLIAFNEISGVHINGTWGEAWWNTISRNRIYGNGTYGIDLENGGNQGLASPVIQSATETEVIGSAVPLATVEIFSDQDGQGALYEGTVTADGSGKWVFSKPEGLAGPYVTATATDTSGNTSEFSNSVYIVPEKVEQEKALPKAFALYPAYPNPFNAETMIRYTLPKSVNIRLSVYNSLGREIRTLVAEDQPAGYYTVRWDGKDEQGRAMPSGVYVYTLQAGEFVQMRKMVLVR